MPAAEQGRDSLQLSNMSLLSLSLCESEQLIPNQNGENNNAIQESTQEAKSKDDSESSVKQDKERNQLPYSSNKVKDETTRTRLTLDTDTLSRQDSNDDDEKKTSQAPTKEQSALIAATDEMPKKTVCLSTIQKFQKRLRQVTIVRKAFEWKNFDELDEGERKADKALVICRGNVG